MATHLVEFELTAGGKAYIEVDEPSAGRELVSRHGVKIEQARQTFENALDGLRPVADAMVERLRNLADTPDEVNLEFGVKLSAKAGAIIASTDAEANIKVALTWRKPRTTG